MAATELPDCYVTSGGRDLFSEEQLREYAAQQVAIERARWAEYLRRARAESILIERQAGHDVIMPFWIMRDPD